MTDPTNSEEILKKLSRRNMLRNSAITATGVVLLPSFMTGCRKVWDFPHGHGGHGGGGVGGQELTPEQLKNAAANLIAMNAWVEDVYLYTGNYEQYLYSILKSGEKPTEWKDFIIDILTEIAVGIFEVAAIEIPGAGPAIAIAAEIIKKWSSGDRPDNLDAQFAEFKLAHLQMQIAISNTLITLADEADNYQKLRDGYKEDIELNGQTYSLLDLATQHFPTVDNGTEYVTIRTAAYDRFRKYIWNVMIIKAGTMTYSYSWPIPFAEDGHLPVPSEYGRDVHYPDERYKSTYLRGYWDGFGRKYNLRYWYFEFDGLELSSDAAKELFKDDYPGHIINPDGLFSRDYVFKQFHKQKPDFFGYHELRKDLDTGPSSNGDAYGFDPDGSFDFTGGDFPVLTQP